MNGHKKLKKYFEGKSFIVFKGPPFKPFEHTKTFFFRKMFFLNFFHILEKCILYQFWIYFKNTHVIKKNKKM